MCMGAPGRIVQISPQHPHLADVEVLGVTRQVNIGLIAPEGPQPGDWVDVHTGMALRLIGEEEARQAIEFRKNVEQGFLDAPAD